MPGEQSSCDGETMNAVTTTARRLQVLVLVGLAVFFAAPVLSMIVRFARPGSVIDTVTDPSLVGVWWFTLWQATASTLLTVAVGLPLTWAVSRYSFRGARFVIGLVTVPFFMPAVVIAAGVKALVPGSPVPSVLWAHMVFNVAVIVRIVGPRWALMDPEIEDTAADLGASRWRTFTTVMLPHVSGALRNAAAIVFVFCFTSFGVIAILGGISRRTVEAEVFTQAVRLGDTRTAVSLSLVQAVVVMTVFALGTRGTRTHDAPTVTVSPRSLTRRDRGVVLTAVTVPTLVVTVPLVAIVLRSFVVDGSLSLEGYRWLLDGTTERVGVNVTSVLAVSMTFAAACAAITTVCAAAIAFSRNPSRAVSTLTAAPLVVSSVALGLGIIITFDTAPFAWRAETWLIPVIHTVVALPLATRTLDEAVRAVPEQVREASASLGAGPWRTWWRVELPIVRPALIRAAGLCGAISVGEFGATSFLSRSNTTTVPIAIQQLLGHPGTVMPQAAYALAALCVVLFSAVFAATV